MSHYSEATINLVRSKRAQRPLTGDNVAGTWADLVKQPGANVDTMLLMTDGTVLAHEFDSSNWHQLTPIAPGSYTNGKWPLIPAMPPNSTIPASSNGPNYGPRCCDDADDRRSEADDEEDD
jgi:hypothetical protein